MRPEDIDKLFRDKLEQHATPPPPALWFDLQEQLEPQEDKRRTGFWMYAVAAAITLLIVAGSGWLMWRTGLPTPGSAGSAPLATQSPSSAPRSTDTTPLSPSASAPAAAGIGTAPGPRPTAPEAPAAIAQTEASGRSAKALAPVAPAPTAPRRQAPTTKMLARTTPLPRAAAQGQASDFRRTEAPTKLAVAAQPAPAPTVVPAPNAPAVLPTDTPGQTVAAATPAMGPIEVEVRQHSASEAVVADAEPGRTRPRVLSVLKQVGRVVRGEKADFTELGLPANPALTLQAHVGNRTLIKTIEL